MLFKRSMALKVKKCGNNFFLLFITPFNDVKISMFCKVHLPTKLFFQDLSTLKIMKKVSSGVV
jgi:hypothetical protein